MNKIWYNSRHTSRFIWKKTQQRIGMHSYCRHIFLFYLICLEFIFLHFWNLYPFLLKTGNFRSKLMCIEQNLDFCPKMYFKLRMGQKNVTKKACFHIIQTCTFQSPLIFYRICLLRICKPPPYTNVLFPKWITCVLNGIHDRSFRNYISKIIWGKKRYKEWAYFYIPKTCLFHHTFKQILFKIFVNAVCKMY